MKVLLAHIFRVLTNLRNYCYSQGFLKQFDLPGRVISVGNIVVGGTGKSPFVVALANYCLQRGERVAILTRGYKSALKSRQFVVLKNAKVIMGNAALEDPQADEAMMQSQQLVDVPVIVGRNRLEAARFYLRNCPPHELPTIFILDDGFQHRRIKRDVNLVLFKKEKLVGNGQLLPAGPLREELKHLKRADAIIITRCASVNQEVGEFFNFAGVPIMAASVTSAVTPINAVARNLSDEIPKDVALVIGVANPDLVKDDAIKLGWSVVSQYFVGDHENFEPTKVVDVALNSAAVVTTEKDYYRQPFVFDSLDKPVYAIKQIYELSEETLKFLAPAFNGEG